MKITPLEIRQKQFTKKTLGGIDRDEVVAYLATLSSDWERSQDEARELRDKLSGAEREVGKLREIESSLYKTLKTAEETGSSIVDQARQSSTLQLREAELKAETLLKEARWQAKNVIEEARQEARKTFNTLQEELARLEEETRAAERYRDSLLSELRLLAQDIIEKVDRRQQSAKPVDFNRPVTRTQPDFVVSPELEAALADAPLAGPATALPSQAAHPAQAAQAEEKESKSFFDEI